MSRNATAKSLIAMLLGMLVAAPLLFAASETREERRARLISRIATHRLSSNNPNGCRACHSNIAYAGNIEEKVCYICHGDTREFADLAKSSRLKIVKAQNVQDDFKQTYRHYVERQGVYNPTEKYPVINVSAPRHAECLDCHDPHYSTPDAPFLGASGLGVDGKFKKNASYEYEVCFKCHGPSLNKPFYQKNKIREFDLNNPSYHPVIDAGKNNYLPSLTKDLKPDSVIACSSCHGSDERSVKRSRGVHGSENNYILVLPFTKEDDSLKPQYDLCFKCHRKDSIMGNQSFRFHREHIDGVKARNWKGTSCYTCHNSHGTQKYRFLIEFNPDVVKLDTVLRKIEYVSDGVFKGSCTLRCHDVDHSPKKYGN